MRAFLILALSLVTGCTVGPSYVRPASPLPLPFRGGALIDARPRDEDWWGAFNDPLLSSLVAQAIAGNTDLSQARARVAQSRAGARAAGAALLPTFDATTGVTAVSQSRDTAIGRITQALGVGRDYTEYAVGTQASWEIDLFGGLRRGREAARAELSASIASAGSVAVSVAAETADAYLSLRGLQARLAVAQDQAANETQLAELVKRRFDQGIAAERELNRAEATLEGVRASIPELRAGIEMELNRLDVLTGNQPGTDRALLERARPVPSAPIPAGAASPIDLLRRRPDVIAAERRLAESTAGVGVATADYYPHLSLSGLFGLASLSTGQLVSGGAVQASGTAGLRWRLFDFGRVDAEVARARGRQAEAFAAWRGAVLSAAEDVETALARLEGAHVRRAALARETASLDRARVQVRQAYAGGIVNLIEVSDADREFLAASDQLAAVRADEARLAVAAYRALGGGWEAEPAETQTHRDGPS